MNKQCKMSRQSSMHPLHKEQEKLITKIFSKVYSASGNKKRALERKMIEQKKDAKFYDNKIQESLK